MHKELKIRVEFKDKPKDNIWKLGEFVEGEVVVIPTVNLDVMYFDYALLAETRGKMRQEKTIITTARLCHNNQMKRGQPCRFPFSFVNHKLSSYTGQNCVISLKMEMTIKLKRAKYDDSLLSGNGIRNLVKPEKIWRQVEYLNFAPNRNHSRITNRTAYMNKVGLMQKKDILYAFLGFIMMNFAWNFFGGLALIGTMAFLIWRCFSIIKERGKAMDEIKIDFKHIDDEKFEIELKSHINWVNIVSVYTYYEIIEEVIDTRGTTDVTHKKSLFESDIRDTLDYNNLARTEFRYPKLWHPQFEAGNCKVLWLCKVNIIDEQGRKYSYSAEIFTENGGNLNLKKQVSRFTYLFHV